MFKFFKIIDYRYNPTLTKELSKTFRIMKKNMIMPDWKELNSYILKYYKILYLLVYIWRNTIIRIMKKYPRT